MNTYAFLHKEDHTYRICEDICKMIIFAQHDIIKQPPYGKIDLICCRNMLIYLNPLLQKKIFATLHFSLNIGGYLFPGPSENLGEFKKFFSETDKKWKIYQNNQASEGIANM
ncbi:MAG: hypothetical protein H7259_07675 [Cytophagales bacterium]|nr:hypothetical protein [Cytophaga sp.]